MLHRILSIACLGLVSTSGLQEIQPNDNSAAAGRLEAGLLTVSLTAAPGVWYPEEAEGPGHQVYAFGEEGRGLSTPGPMLRVPVGTAIKVTIRNRVPGKPLHVHGFHDRPGSPTVLVVPSGETRTAQFRVTSPGTYFYWGSTRGVTRIQDRFGPESQLMGALIVDPPGDVPRDHVYMIGIEDDSAAVPADRHTRAAVINGRSWPHSQISTVTVGDTVRMRWINTSDRTHPIHLHGFYFTVNGRGDIARDTSYDDASKRLAVTELMLQGQTMSVSWVPERAGNWLMHCHMAAHMSPDLRSRQVAMTGESKHNHTMDVMAGLVIGWRVLPGAKSAAPSVEAGRQRRNLRLLVQSSAHRYWGAPGMGFVLQNGPAPRLDSVEIPGPPIVLTRGEPVEITVVNNLRGATSLHWHGIELDSYFDGVSGWSGDQRKTAPHVNPGDSFAVRFTPPRAGTFIYHSHFDEERQLGSGLYGPIIVLEPGERYEPETDRAWILSQAGPTKGASRARVTLNGSRSPVMEMQAKRLYRIRLIHIAATLPLRFSLLRDTIPVAWRAVAKDGADLPPAQARVRPARQLIGVGEVYDFEFTPEEPGQLRLMVKDPAGRTRVTGVIRVHP
jgi:FtsP/CotA-like multicopper oxidase with cupredoxin domain